MGELRESQICPKRERCKHGEDCIYQDTFRGEHLCFENKKVNAYELQMEINRRKAEELAKAKKGRRKR